MHKDQRNLFYNSKDIKTFSTSSKLRGASTWKSKQIKSGIIFGTQSLVTDQHKLQAQKSINWLL